MPNSPAIPLPSAVYGANFRGRPAGKVISNLLIRRLFLLVRGHVPAAERCFSLPSGKGRGRADLQEGCVFTREFPLRIKRRGVEMRFAIDAPDPRATNPDPVLLKEVKRARRCFDALVSGRIGSVAELASLEGISDRYEAVASVVI